MAFFNYRARNAEGKATTGLVEAPNSSVAVQLLHDKQLFVITMKETKERQSFSSASVRFKRIKFSDVVNFTRQLSTMVTAGLSLPESLTILRTQTTNQAFSQMLLDIEHHIVGGGNLADALSKYPGSFSTMFVSLVRAGESSGMLDQVLARLSENLESEKEFKSKVTGAMIYPVIIFVAMGIVVILMLTVVMPKLTDMYKDFGVTLPPTTQMLINFSKFFTRFWWLLAGLAVAAGSFFLKFKKTALGELAIDTLMLRLPLIGELKKKVILVEFTRTLAMLVSSGIHFLDALNILRDSLANVLYRNAVSEIAKRVEKGFAIGESFSQYAIFPPIVAQMIKIGEETGKLDETLIKVSKYFQSEAEQLVKGLTTAIEPVIMIFLGVGVGFIVISVITPIYNLTSQFK